MFCRYTRYSRSIYETPVGHRSDLKSNLTQSSLLAARWQRSSQRAYLIQRVGPYRSHTIDRQGFIAGRLIRMMQLRDQHVRQRYAVRIAELPITLPFEKLLAFRARRPIEGSLSHYKAVSNVVEWRTQGNRTLTRRERTHQTPVSQCYCSTLHSIKSQFSRVISMWRL